MFNFFKKKTQAYVEIQYSRNKLLTDLNDILNRFYVYKNDEAMKDIFQVLQIGKNMAILDAAKARDDNERRHFQAKVDVYAELDNEITQAVNRISHEKREGKGPQPGAINMFKRVSNQAGSAI